MNEHDMLLSIDMDELGVRPFNWIDINKDIGLTDSTHDYFSKEKTIDFTVYSAEIQLINNGKKITTNEDDSSMSDDDGENIYEIDPETGEKIFHGAAFVSSTPLPSPSDKWIEEYLSNIESSSNQLLPNTTTTNNSEIGPFSLLEPIDDQSDLTNFEWCSELINLDKDSESIMFADPIISHQFNNDNENKLNQTILLSNGSMLNVPFENEYSMSSSTNSSRQNRLYSTLESDSDITFIETKLEKIEQDEYQMPHMLGRRSSTRSNYQEQQDDDAIRRYNIPLKLTDITQSTTEEYNRHLARLTHLTVEQTHIIKDIRRRGKNKVAAQNCRKRKATGVDSLLEEVDELKRVKDELEERKRAILKQITETRNQYEYLHRQVLPNRQLPPAIIVK